LGWRGLLVPELAQVTSYTRTSLISAGIWMAYHLPVMLLAGYHSTAPIGYVLLCFATMLTGMSFMVAWLRLRSGSIWPAVLIHASHNTFLQVVFDQLTVDTGPTEYITSEFGAGIAIVYLLIGAWCWRHGATSTPGAGNAQQAVPGDGPRAARSAGA
jgi:membrane protease YdiL (CAAX protease family)